MSVAVSCHKHGPMKYRPDFRWWECLGFAGEGCDVQLVYDEDIKRIEAGIPGVKVEMMV